MKDRIQVGVIGLGARGYSLLRDVFLTHDKVEIAAVCDVYEDRTMQGADIVEQRTGKRPVATTNYREILTMEEVDAVLLCTSW